MADVPISWRREAGSGRRRFDVRIRGRINRGTGSAAPSPNPLNKPGNDTPVQASLTPAHYIEACRKRQAYRKSGDRALAIQRHLHGVGIFVLVCVLAGSVQAQTFNSLAAFGGSLSGSGNLAQSRGLPAGTSFTTDPDPAGPGIAAQAFGAQGTNSCAGETNHAWGGGVDQDACLARASRWALSRQFQTASITLTCRQPASNGPFESKSTAWESPASSCPAPEGRSAPCSPYRHVRATRQSPQILPGTRGGRLR